MDGSVKWGSQGSPFSVCLFCLSVKLHDVFILPVKHDLPVFLQTQRAVCDFYLSNLFLFMFESWPLICHGFVSFCFVEALLCIACFRCVLLDGWSQRLAQCWTVIDINCMLLLCAVVDSVCFIYSFFLYPARFAASEQKKVEERGIVWAVYRS